VSFTEPSFSSPSEPPGIPTLTTPVNSSSTAAVLLTNCNHARPRIGVTFERTRRGGSVRFGVLGPIEVEVDGALIPIVGPQQRRLLGLLIAERGRVVSTDRMVDALWPDGEAPEGAGRSVLTYVSRLRATLGGGGIVTRPPGYLLDLREGTCDADEFEAMLDEGDRALPELALECYDAALRLWRGAPFGEYGGEWWAVAESSRLRERHVVACEERTRSLITTTVQSPNWRGSLPSTHSASGR
jgi:hypothetical protein